MKPSAHKLFLPNDPGAMRQAINELRQRGYYVRRCTIQQIKVFGLNFWPHTGAVTIDSEGRHPGRGLAEFLRLAEERYPRRRKTTQPQLPPSGEVEELDLSGFGEES